ncbi:uncharacterized protein LOC132738634, partial [Ruditapes philippinarum]|uniref:uncharacterized protein LOC132738634 n=1 Tax=Ruditapes philippinarum TaxID=129788 RepID=UPI00295B2391
MDGKDPMEGELEVETERKRTLTMKGLEYNKEIKSKARLRMIETLNTKTEELKGLLQHETSDKQTVKGVYSSWLNNYEQLLIAHEQYKKLLNETELHDDNSQFENITSDYAYVKHEAEQWFLKNCSVPETSEQLETKSHHSGSSRSSSRHSSISSNLSIAKMKENQRKAELLARASALKEQRKLEEAKLSLQMKEKEFEIKTELQVSDARTKVLEDLERSMVDDQLLEDNIKFTDHINK